LDFSDHGNSSQVYSVDEHIYFAIHPEDDNERDLAQAFWDDTVGIEETDRDGP